MVIENKNNVFLEFPCFLSIGLFYLSILRLKQIFDNMAEIKRKQYSGGDEYYGQFNQADERHGYGVYRYSDGSVYIGEWSNNTCTGKGIYRANNGDIYRDRFINGLMYDRGSRTSSDGHKYIGDYLFGRSEGKGMYIWANGEKYEGEFLCGKLQGNGIYYFSNGTKHIGRWINGEAVSIGTCK
jgi:hypothetical protein